VSEALEAHQADETSDMHRSAPKVNGFGTTGDRFIIQRWQPSAHDVDDAVATVYAQMVSSSDVISRQHFAIAQSPGIRQLEETQHCRISLGTIWHEQITVLGGTNMTVGDYCEAADNDIFEPDRVSVSNDADEIRTRGLVRGQDQPYNQQPGAQPPAARVSDQPPSVGSSSTPYCWREAARPLPDLSQPTRPHDQPRAAESVERTSYLHSTAPSGAPLPIVCKSSRAFGTLQVSRGTVSTGPMQHDLVL
jgi:hypothetical protein